MKLIFASNNKNKIIEIQNIVRKNIEIITLKEAGIFEELPEPYDTFHDNAQSKAQYIYHRTKTDCFSEDSGLIVPALNGEPGVYSARYAGSPTNDAANNDKLLQKMKNVKDRYAYYQSVICFIESDKISYFEGKCEGHISEFPMGNVGFGYDPIFIPNNYDSTFSEMTIEEKLKISHRTKSFIQLAKYITSNL